MGWSSLCLVLLVLLWMDVLISHLTQMTVCTDIGVCQVLECHSDLVHTRVLVEAIVTRMMTTIEVVMQGAMEEEMIMTVMVGHVETLIDIGMMTSQEERRTTTKMMDMVGIETVTLKFIAKREASLTGMIVLLPVIVNEIGAMRMRITFLPGARWLPFLSFLGFAFKVVCS
jgi:hypothetical protein